jgi:hypothetical protein
VVSRQSSKLQEDLEQSQNRTEAIGKEELEPDRPRYLSLYSVKHHSLKLQGSLGKKQAPSQMEKLVLGWSRCQSLESARLHGSKSKESLKHERSLSRMEASALGRAGYQSLESARLRSATSKDSLEQERNPSRMEHC